MLDDVVGIRHTVAMSYESVVFQSDLLNNYPWLRLAPPVIAIVLAIIVKDVNVALILATVAGAALLAGFSFEDWVDRICSIFTQQIADADHASVILFTVLLGAMIGLMNDSGGTKAVIDRISGFARTRQRGQVLTWLSGLIVFFDDYANTMLIGGSMRPLCDRLKISRAKLAFLIDATAAPVAGLLLSTWTAFEIDQVNIGLQEAGLTASPGAVFLATIPYRIYPLLAIAFVAAVAISGKDFGVMLKAETEPQPTLDDQPVATGSTGSIWFAILPIVVLVGVIFQGVAAEVYRRGLSEVAASGLELDSYRLLLVASMAASTVALLGPVVTRKMSLLTASESWTQGITSMIPAIIVLILAWSISAVCSSATVESGPAAGQPLGLHTAQYIIDLIGDALTPGWMPSVAFLTAGAIALSIGSSFTTMALLLPLFTPLAHGVLSADATVIATADHPIFLATVGAILAGAIFGDHCSPISDTTVLSSAAAGCNHLQHVATQLPYALLVAGCSLLLGYLPIGYGLPWWIALPLSGTVCIGVLLAFGRRPLETAATSDAGSTEVFRQTEQTDSNESRTV